jgi:serine protease Do
MNQWLGARSCIAALLALTLATDARAAASPPSTRAAAPSPDAFATLQKTERVFEDLAKRVRPAVVNIRRFTRDAAWWAACSTESRVSGWRLIPQNDLLHPGHRPHRGASGFLVSADGYIVTLRRVVVDPQTDEAAPIVDVEVGLEHFTADVVALEPTLDLAILKLHSESPLPFLRFGDSSKSQPGHWAIAFGDPDGSEQSFIPGFIVVQPARECYQDDLSATYMQTSVPVSDAALGGPVVSIRGEVIGVSSRRGGPTIADPLAPLPGSGFAVPSNIANAILQGMLMRENKESPWLGFSVLTLSEAMRARNGDGKPGGILIDNVFDPSPASKLGIRVGDILKSMEGEPIRNVTDFQRVLYHHGPGSRVRLGMVRDRKPLELTATIERRPPEATTH